MKPAVRILVLFTGSGKTTLLEDMDRGTYPKTVLYQLRREAGANTRVAYQDTELRFFKKRISSRIARLVSVPFVFLRSLTYNVLVTSDTSVAACLSALVYRMSGGLLGPRWYFITVNSSVLIEKTCTKPLRRTALLLSWRLTHRIICLTNFQKQDLLSVGIPERKIIIIPLGVDAGYFSQERDPVTKEYIVSIGNDRARDYPLLLEAAPRIPYPILIATTKKNIPEDTLLPENVTVTYGLPIADVRKHYANARMLIVPIKEELDSEGSDCSGQTVILEALSAGVPVLATPCPWVKEYLTDGIEYGALPYDASGVVEKVCRAGNDQAYLSSLAKEGRATVQNKYTVSHFAKTLLTYIREDVY
jgi:glycosyltransferase involved in cell wall biosynthesis